MDVMRQVLRIVMSCSPGSCHIQAAEITELLQENQNKHWS